MSAQHLIRRLVAVLDERDRARDLAAALEDENARLAAVAVQERDRLTAERDEAMARVIELQAEHETTLRKLDAARAEIARVASCQASPR